MVGSAAIYTRISRDRYGESLGVRRQERLCRAVAKRHGLDVVEVFTDNDVSATSGKPRPEYLRMLEGVREGRFSVLVALDSDRLLRRPIEFEGLAEIGEPLGLRIEYDAGRVDFRTGEGVMEARIRAAIDAEEVAKLKKRVRRKATEIAEAGRYGGGPRPFGYQADGRTLHSVEAPAYRELFERVIAGDGLRTIGQDFEERGIVGRNGHRLTVGTLGRLVRSPRAAGLRKHRGEIIGKAEWEPIVSPEVQAQATAALAARRGLRAPTTTRHSRLLSGLVRCSGCGSKMYVVAYRDGRRPPYYRAECCGISVGADYVEDDVEKRFLRRLSHPRTVERLARSEDLPSETLGDVTRLELELEAVAEDYSAGKITRKEWTILRDGISRRLKVARETLDRSTTAGVGTLDAPKVLDLWHGLDVERKRSMLALVISDVEVDPIGSGAHVYDSRRVRVNWRDARR